MQEVLIVLIIFATLFGVIYVFFMTRHRERTALIEKGVDASLFKTGTKYNFKNFTLTSGMFLIGIGLGIMVGTILSSTIVIEEGAAYTLSIFLFAGLSLVINYFLVRNMEQPTEL